MYISVLWRNLYRTKTHNKYTSDNLEVKGNYQQILWDAGQLSKPPTPDHSRLDAGQDEPSYINIPNSTALKPASHSKL